MKIQIGNSVDSDELADNKDSDEMANMGVSYIKQYSFRLNGRQCRFR